MAIFNSKLLVYQRVNPCFCWLTLQLFFCIHSQSCWANPLQVFTTKAALSRNLVFFSHTRSHNLSLRHTWAGVGPTLLSRSKSQVSPLPLFFGIRSTATKTTQRCLLCWKDAALATSPISCGEIPHLGKKKDVSVLNPIIAGWSLSFLWPLFSCVAKIIIKVSRLNPVNQRKNTSYFVHFSVLISKSMQKQDYSINLGTQCW